MNSSPKINVLGGYVSLGGEVLPADNQFGSIRITFQNRDKAIEALCQRVFAGATPFYLEEEQPPVPEKKWTREPEYDPRLDNVDIPQEVYEAASTIINFFNMKGHTNWQFMGLQPVKRP